MNEEDIRAIRLIERIWSDVVQPTGKALVIRQDILSEMVKEDDVACRLVFDGLCEKHAHLQTNKERQVNGAILVNLAIVYEIRGDGSLMTKLKTLGMLWQ